MVAKLFVRPRKIAAGRTIENAEMIDKGGAELQPARFTVKIGRRQALLNQYVFDE